MTCHGPFRKSIDGFEKGDAAFAGDEDGGRNVRGDGSATAVVMIENPDRCFDLDRAGVFFFC